MKMNFISPKRKIVLSVAVVSVASQLAIPLIHARPGAGRPAESRPAPAPRAAPARPAMVDRPVHGSVRHVDTHVVARPPEVHVDEHVEHPEHAVVAPRNVLVRHDAEVDIHRPHGWDNFAYGRRHAVLPRGYLSFNIGGVPWYFCDGIYYQPADGGYEEAYPPVGAEIPQPPDGAIEVDSGGQVYYYAGGAFYVQQPDGTYAIVPTPIGAIVPELPPGATQVSINGTVAYQFNGAYYQPVFANGVTQYETFAP